MWGAEAEISKRSTAGEIRDGKKDGTVFEDSSSIQTRARAQSFLSLLF